VEVSSVCACQGQAEKLDSSLARGACVVGVAVPTAGAGVAKGFVGGRQETREGEGPVARLMRVWEDVGSRQLV
jgi:hypothetical protein